MKLLIIIFVILLIIIKFWKNYISNSLSTQLKYLANGINPLLVIIIFIEYVLGAVIVIKILLKILC